ncbi:MAG: ORF6N domain-containing protein [Candidatus Sabulitectum sp.]|nr:ORF6N domain-containing protein [Candidatus Sabulitectum sp.]
MQEEIKNLITEKIFITHGKKVILDSDLAGLFGVETKRLNEQVRRNIEKFPEDFMFQLTTRDFNILKSQFATSSSGNWGGRRKPPSVFTEHGALQAANVLNSEQANKMSVFIVRTFVHLREMLLSNEKLSERVNQLEGCLIDHDEILIDLVYEIQKLIDTPKQNKEDGYIGFTIPEKNEEKHAIPNKRCTSQLKGSW